MTRVTRAVGAVRLSRDTGLCWAQGAHWKVARKVLSFGRFGTPHCWYVRRCPLGEPEATVGS